MKFEWISARERKFFSQAKGRVADLADLTTQVYRDITSMVRGVALGVGLSAAVAGVVYVRDQKEQEREEWRSKVYVYYCIERAPHGNPQCVSRFVSPKELAEIVRDPYNSNIQY